MNIKYLILIEGIMCLEIIINLHLLKITSMQKYIYKLVSACFSDDLFKEREKSCNYS